MKSACSSTKSNYRHVPPISFEFDEIELHARPANQLRSAADEISFEFDEIELHADGCLQTSADFAAELENPPQ